MHVPRVGKETETITTDHYDSCIEFVESIVGEIPNEVKQTNRDVFNAYNNRTGLDRFRDTFLSKYEHERTTTKTGAQMTLRFHTAKIKS